MVKGYIRGKYTIIFIVFKVLVAIIYRGINRRIVLRMIIINAAGGRCLVCSDSLTYNYCIGRFAHCLDYLQVYIKGIAT